jgi:hypothetical protein
MPLVNGNSAQAPNLPEPSGLVELDVSQPARLVDQLDEMTDSGARPIDSIALNGTHTIGAEAKKSEEETPSREEEREVAPSKEKQQKEDKREPVKRAAPASAKKGAKKGGKKGKGKEKAIDQDVAADDDELANDSDHEEGESGRLTFICLGADHSQTTTTTHRHLRCFLHAQARRGHGASDKDRNPVRETPRYALCRADDRSRERPDSHRIWYAQTLASSLVP